MVLGSDFDPCHFFGPKKLRQERCVLGWGWGLGFWKLFSLSKQQPPIMMLEREIKKQIHSWFVALILPVALLKTIPSIKHSSGPCLRERWLCVSLKTPSMGCSTESLSQPLRSQVQQGKDPPKTQGG